MRKYGEALKKCSEELGGNVEHTHIYEQDNSIFILFHLYDNFLNLWRKLGKLGKIKKRNVLFELKGKISINEKIWMVFYEPP